MLVEPEYRGGGGGGGGVGGDNQWSYVPSSRILRRSVL